MSALAAVRGPFRALTETVVPDASALDETGWDEVESVVAAALAERPEVGGKVRAFLFLLEWVPATFWGSRFTRLDASRRARLLAALERAPVQVLRRGTWGVRTLALLGYYGRAAAGIKIGWNADRRGWAARR